MAAAQFTSASALTIKSLPSFEGLRSAKGISNVNVYLPHLNSARSFRGLITNAVSVSAAKYTSIKPLGDRVLIKTKIVEEKTSSGIFLPSSAQKKQDSGKIVALGAGQKVGDVRLPFSVKTGASVIYYKYAGMEVEVDGSSHMIMKEDDIIGILETDDIEDLKPLNDRILVKVAEAELKTAGGLLLAQSNKEKPSIGSVIATGPGPLDEAGKRIPLSVSTGDTVMYSKYAGSDLQSSDGTQYIALRVSDLMAVLS